MPVFDSGDIVLGGKEKGGPQAAHFSAHKN